LARRGELLLLNRVEDTIQDENQEDDSVRDAAQAFEELQRA
jgi:hypothetical protein